MAEERTPCSIVLEGGVTSAVVYASLLARLSRSYTFHRLGGASSGAVAAAAAAAAEFGRLQPPEPPDAPSSGPADAPPPEPADAPPLDPAGTPSPEAAASRPPFDQLGDFPAVLAAVDGRDRTALLRLFQPPPGAARAGFGVAIAALDRQGGGAPKDAAVRVGVALVRHFPVAALLAAALVGAAGWLAAGWWQHRYGCGLVIDQLVICALGWFASVLPTAAAAGVGLAAWAVFATARALGANHWGLCSGMDAEGFDRPALTPTLYGLFQSLAGRSLAQPPLTFGELWQGAPADPRQPAAPPKTSDKRRIDLQIISTAVNMARPVRLPGDPGDPADPDAHPLRSFFYDPAEWAGLFPAPVLQHLRAHARPATLTHDDGRTLIALPAPAHWPVLMAARFSLSFPLLLSAVPMYVAVRRRVVPRGGAVGGPPPFEARKVYFSDGGITSNCPVHLFDVALPASPTFGVNLLARPGGSGVHISRSDARDPEVEAAATRDAAAWTSPLPFGVAIVRSMMNWRDSLQRSLPGYRERMVHVGLPPEAGGLNLAMTPDTIRLLGRVGGEAAERLERDFSVPRHAGEANAWERHRWTRMRTTLSALRAYTALFADRLATGDPDYLRLPHTGAPVRDPFQSEAARQQALDLMRGTHELMRTLEATAPRDALDRNAPQPQPTLHLSPPW